MREIEIEIVRDGEGREGKGRGGERGFECFNSSICCGIYIDPLLTVQIGRKWHISADYGGGNLRSTILSAEGRGVHQLCTIILLIYNLA